GNLLFVAYGGGHFISINKTTNTVIDEFQNTQLVICPSIATDVNRIFVRTQDVSPADIRYVSYDDAGKFVGNGHSQYSGSFPDATKTWVFPGGVRVLDNAGIVYATDSLSQLNSFAGPISDIGFYGTNIPIVLSGSAVTAYSAGILPTGSVTLPYAA